MSNRFTPTAERALDTAEAEARAFKQNQIGTEHLLLGILSERESVAARLLAGHRIGYETVREKLLRDSVPTAVPPVLSFSPRAKQVLEEATRLLPGPFGRIGTEQLLRALLSVRPSTATVLLESMNLIPEECLKEMSQGASLPSGKMPSDSKASLPPLLAKYGQSLTEQAEQNALDPVIGREAETEQLIRILCRRSKNNPCLIGEPGVGKTAVVEGLARRIVDHEVPSLLRNKSIVTLDLSSMIAGAKYRGDFEDRMKGVLKEVTEREDLILFIDELHTIVGAGSAEGALDAANIIKPILARGKLRVIGATTVTEYRKHIEKDAALERRFQPILVEEPSEEETRAILRGLQPRYEEHHGITITEEAMEAAVHLSVHYLPERRLPDKAIDLIDEAASAKRIEAEHQHTEEIEVSGILRGIAQQKEEAIRERRLEDAAALHRLESDYRQKHTERLAKPSIILSAEDIAKILEKRLKISIATDRLNTLPGLEEHLRARIFGQEEAIGQIARTLRRGWLGLQNADRPIASFLFLGPSGVGKTALATVLAEELFGSQRALLRFDMSEYGEKHSQSSLIGSPPGYIGYGEEGVLTGRVHRQPRCLLLFDEAEKAHPDILHLLLQILDSGFLHDAMGRRVDFRHTVIILTANLDQAEARPTVGFGETEATRSAVELARRQFRPELVGRLDAVVRFAKLSRETATTIVHTLAEELFKRLSPLGITVEIAPSLLAAIAHEGLSSHFGARTLHHCFREHLEDPLIAAITEEGYGVGDTLFCEEKDKKTVIRVITKEKNPHML
ncbi:MAG: ATP-dependent Clp protease ATP-binding subunit [Ruminococcaceae bacterium]|nr:ATP-dependent Clp protease ATP-binding subunit [Oscillospiraceae bacterium]